MAYKTKFNITLTIIFIILTIHLYHSVSLPIIFALLTALMIDPLLDLPKKNLNGIAKCQLSQFSFSS